MTQFELANLISEWFDKDISNKWCTPVGKCLKHRLKALGNWKNAPRGDPRKGGLTMHKNRSKRLVYKINKKLREKTGSSNGLTQDSRRGGNGD